jgi:hypothetical protein
LSGAQIRQTAHGRARESPQGNSRAKSWRNMGATAGANERQMLRKAAEHACPGVG